MTSIGAAFDAAAFAKAHRNDDALDAARSISHNLSGIYAKPLQEMLQGWASTNLRINQLADIVGQVRRVGTIDRLGWELGRLAQVQQAQRRNWAGLLAKQIAATYQPTWQLNMVADVLERHRASWSLTTDISAATLFNLRKDLLTMSQTFGQIRPTLVDPDLLRRMTEQVRPDLSPLADFITRPQTSPEAEEPPPEVKEAAQEVGLDPQQLRRLSPLIWTVLAHAIFQAFMVSSTVLYVLNEDLRNDILAVWTGVGAWLGGTAWMQQNLPKREDREAA